MTAAYNKIYLEDAMDCLGEALDYVSNACQIDMSMFFDMFLTGSFAGRFEEGEPSIVSGTSGTELVHKVMSECGLDIAFPPALVDYDSASYEYICGQLLAFLQWYSGLAFAQILENISLDAMEEYVNRFAVTTEEERVSMCDEILKGFGGPVRIQVMRKACGFSQRQLSEAAGVNIRTLQQYEIKSKDINKAAASTVLELAKTMGCTARDLMEFGNE